MLYKSSVTGVGTGEEHTMYLTKQTTIGIGVDATGTVTYSVQISFDGALWFNHADLTDKTADAYGYCNFPVAAIRVNVTAGTGTAALTVLQAV